MTGLPPHRLPLDRGGTGKPFLTSAGDGIEFNLSRTGDLALLAVTWNHAVGVDVERIDPSFPILDVVRPRVSPTTRTELDGLPEPQARLAAWRLWVRYEANAKMSGVGLHEPIRLDAPSRALTLDVPGRNSTVASLAVAGADEVSYRMQDWQPVGDNLTRC